MSATLDRHFRRFRDQGDVSALAEVFDEVAPEMLRVARHLATPSIDPHDLIQSTFLVAIERAAAYDPARPVKQWLLGILAKEAAYQRRRGARVVEPDRVSTHPEPDPLESAVDSEFSGALEDALELLPAKYREVVRPILVEGKNPRDLAREVGQRPGTVRVQLHRGLRLLRESLPAGFALGALAGLRPTGFSQTGLAAAGSGPVVPGLAAVRMRVLLEGAGRGGATSGAVGLAGSAWAGWRLLGAVGLGAALTGLGVALYGGFGGRAPRVEPLEPTASLTRSAAADDVSGPATGGRGLAPVAAAPIGDSSSSIASLVTVTVLGRVLGMDCQPAAGALVELEIDGAGRFEGAADRGGDFRIPVVLANRPGPDGEDVARRWNGTVRAQDANGYAHARTLGLRTDAREAYLGSLMLGEADPVTVRVEDPDGRALAGVEVGLVDALDRTGRPGRLALASGTTGAEGSARFPAVPRGPILAWAHQRSADLDGEIGRSGATALRGGRAREHVTVVLDAVGVPAVSGAGRTGGEVIDPDRPVREPARRPEHAILRLISPAGPVWSPDWGFLEAGVPLDYRTNDDGETEVRIEGPVGESLVLEIEVDGFGPVTQRVDLRSPGLPNPVDVHLDPLAWLEVDVPRADGMVVDLELQRFDAGMGAWGPSRLDFGGLAVPNTPEGRFRFDGLTRGRYRLRERRSDLVSEPIEVSGDEGRMTGELDLSVLRWVTGRVVVPDPELLPGVSLVMEAEGIEPSPNRWTPLQNAQMTTRPRRNGTFRMRVPADRDVRLRAYHPQLVSEAPHPDRLGDAFGWVDLAAHGDAELTFELTYGEDLTLPLHGLAGNRDLRQVRVLVYAGEPVGAPLVRLYPQVEDGVARFTGVPPGTWTLFVDLGARTGVRPLVMRNVAVTPGQALELPQPDLSPGSSLVVNLTGPLPEGERITLFARSHGEPEYVRTASAVASERIELSGLGPGDFTLRIQTPRSPRPLLQQELHIAPDEVRELTLGL